MWAYYNLNFVEIKICKKKKLWQECGKFATKCNTCYFFDHIFTSVCVILCVGMLNDQNILSICSILKI